MTCVTCVHVTQSYTCCSGDTRVSLTFLSVPLGGKNAISFRSGHCMLYKHKQHWSKAPREGRELEMQVSREERVFPGGGNGRCNGSGANVCVAL